MKSKSPHIILRAFTPDDIPQVALLCNNKKLWDNLRDTMPHPYHEKDAAFFINQVCAKENPQLTFAIEYEDKLVGCIGLIKQTDVYRLNAEIGYWVGEPYWNIGIATEAIKLASHYAFEYLDLIRVYAAVFDFNTASKKALEKAGFTLEAVFEKAVIKNGTIYDEHRYALLK